MTAPDSGGRRKKNRTLAFLGNSQSKNYSGREERGKRKRKKPATYLKARKREE